MDKKLQEELKPVVEEIKTSVAESVKTEVAAVTPAVTEEVFKRLKDELPHRKDIFGSNNGDSEKKTIQEGKEKAAEMLKAQFRKDGAQVKALSEGTAADGGYLVPEIFSSEIIRI